MPTAHTIPGVTHERPATDADPPTYPGEKIQLSKSDARAA